jgi:TonB family protein
MLEANSRSVATPNHAGVPYPSQQPRKLILALLLLVVALVAVLVRDRHFWFGPDQSLLDAELVEPQTAQKPASKRAVPNNKDVTSRIAKKQTSAKPAAPAKTEEAPAVTATRTVLPPLEVEVVAGDTHRSIRPSSHVEKVQITSATPALAKETSAVEREAIAAAAPAAAYPMLTQHTSVQGSVILQAIINADGMIQDLRVLSGPAILASAAQQAVREWRFKPVWENGQAVETKARITVNFTIKVADSAGSVS